MKDNLEKLLTQTTENVDFLLSRIAYLRNLFNHSSCPRPSALSPPSTVTSLVSPVICILMTPQFASSVSYCCLLYTSDAADDWLVV